MLKLKPCGTANETRSSRYQYNRFQRAGRRAGIDSEQMGGGCFYSHCHQRYLVEYFEVINLPKFKLKQATIDRIIRYCYQFAEFVVSEEHIQFIKADPKDDKFLEAAIAGDADYIVSGDMHLLELKKFRSVPILTAREFVDWLKVQ
jgi:putative PIN family toxin of toxin-antitoxin system